MMIISISCKKDEINPNRETGYLQVSIGMLIHINGANGTGKEYLINEVILPQLESDLNVKKIFADAGYINGGKIIYFFDSTMFRIWFIDKNIPCIPPHIMNVQLAPCQRPPNNELRCFFYRKIICSHISKKLLKICLTYIFKSTPVIMPALKDNMILYSCLKSNELS